MLKKCRHTFQDERFFVSGELCFANVSAVYQKSLLALNKCAKLDFDFSQLKSSDSSGLALMLEWARFAKQNNKPIKFSAVSSELSQIAKTVGLFDLIESA